MSLTKEERELVLGTRPTRHKGPVSAIDIIARATCAETLETVPALGSTGCTCDLLIACPYIRDYTKFIKLIVFAVECGHFAILEKLPNVPVSHCSGFKARVLRVLPSSSMAP